MTTFRQGTGQYGTLRLEATYTQSITGNYSDVTLVLWLDVSAAYGHLYSPGADCYVDTSVNTGSHTSFTFDFTGGAGSKKLHTHTYRITHSADGSHNNISVRGHIDGTGTDTVAGPTTVSGTLALDTIPRKSSFQYINQSVFGSSITATIDRKSSSFTHTVTIKVGSHSATIATKTSATSVSYTIPASWADQSPNGTSTGVTYTLTTYSGSTNLGSTTASGAILVPASMVPTIGGITNSEATAVVASEVGAYVQSLSKLALAITGAAGVYGSTIKSYKITADGQTINSASGTTDVINSQGSIPIVGTVTDSRGRTVSKTVTVPVLAYAPPLIDANLFTLDRATVDGVADDGGDRILIGLDASVQSLVNTVEKNALTYQVFTRQRGDAPFVLKTSATPGGISCYLTALIATYAVEDSWDVLVTVADLFNASSVGGTVATGGIPVDVTAGGLGIGKYHEQGSVDALGQMYQNNGRRVLDVADVPADTGWVTNLAGISWAAGWTNDYNNFRHAGASIDMSMSFYYSGSTVTTAGDANIADTLIATIPDGWRPHAERLIAGGRDGYNMWSFHLDPNGALSLVGGAFPGQQLTSGDRIYISTMYME